MKWEAFSETDVSQLDVLFSKKYHSFLAPEDRKIVTGLMQFVKRSGQWPIIDGSYGFQLLHQMLDTGRLFYSAGNHQRLRWAEAVPCRLGWQQSVGREGYWEATVDLPSDLHAFPLDPPVYISSASNACGPLQTEQPTALAARWLAARSMTVADVSGFCLRLAKEYPNVSFPTPACARIEETDRVDSTALLIIQERALLDKRDREETWIDLHDRLRLRLRFQYGKAAIAWDAAESAVAYREEGIVKRVPRNRSWERSVIEQLHRWGFESKGQPANLDLFDFDSSTFALSAESSWRDLLHSDFPQLDQTSWQPRCAAGLQLHLVAEDELQPRTHYDPDGTYSLSLEVSVEGQSLPLLPILHRALRREAGRTFRQTLDWLQTGSFAIRLPNDPNQPVRLAVLPGAAVARLADQLYELFDQNPFDSKARARINRWRLGELAAAGLVDASSAEGVSSVVAICQRIGSGIDVKSRRPPRNFKTKLRSYQQMGLGWLSVLHEVEAGGILADDMGLGKTAQTIAHLLELKNKGQLDRGALIIAPTSVMENWSDELARFAPDLSVLRYHGKDRRKVENKSSRPDVVLTTYALLRLESERLQSERWSLVVLDEAQYIKNAASRTAAAARGLRADRRLCLTGTPIENRLEDIWSLFEFLLPGFLSDEATFRSRIAQPLKESESSAWAAELRQRLKRRLSPFVLRRTKAEVLQDLPERTEVILPVSMSATQREFYDSYCQTARSEIRASLSSGGLAGARMLILSRLLRLRQICCDPRLLEEGCDQFGVNESAKLEALLELLAQLRAQGSRTLVFSQFTSMLALISESLTQNGIEHLTLTGASLNRGELVERFQSGSMPVFLISLRAGGAGLNLTAADCVIHFDPWWNPAVERQASDRIHRIGQQKPVFIYKLIADDSIESRIQILQRNKLALVEDLLAEGNIDRLEIDSETIDYLLGE